MALRPINFFSVPLPPSQKPPPHFFFSLKRTQGKGCIPENLVSASMTLERNQFHKHTSQHHLLATDTNHGASLLPLFSQPSMGPTHFFSSDQCITRCNSLTVRKLPFASAQLPEQFSTPVTVSALLFLLCFSFLWSFIINNTVSM